MELRLVTNPETPAKYTVGRLPGNDFVVEGEYVSRVHAIIETKGDLVYLTDESTNGTFYKSPDGAARRIKKGMPVLIHDGDIVFLANIPVRMRVLIPI